MGVPVSRGSSSSGRAGGGGTGPPARSDPLPGLGPLERSNPPAGLGPLERSNPPAGLGPLERSDPPAGLGPLERSNPLAGLGPLRGLGPLAGSVALAKSVTLEGAVTLPGSVALAAAGVGFVGRRVADGVRWRTWEMSGSAGQPDELSVLVSAGLACSWARRSARVRRGPSADSVGPCGCSPGAGSPPARRRPPLPEGMLREFRIDRPPVGWSVAGAWVSGVVGGSSVSALAGAGWEWLGSVAARKS